MKVFTSEWIERLNAQTQGGIFFLAAELSVAEGDVRYYATMQYPVDFEGHTYQPLPMLVEGLAQNSQQNLPAVRLMTTNVTGAVGAFLETTDILGHDVLLRLLHLDLLGNTANQDQARLHVLAVEWDQQQATFSLGINIGLNEILPRGLISASEFPGVPEGLRRASIL